MELYEAPEVLVASGEYWHMVIRSNEWSWIIQRIEKDYPTPKGMDGPPEYVIYFKGTVPLILIAKRRVPFEVIKARLGLPAESIPETCKLLVLHPLSDDSALPKPTVDYWGEA